MANRFLSNIRINDAYTFPASDGTNNQVIKTDGSGNLSFGQLATDSASVIHKDTFTGDGSTTTFNMSNALNDENQSNIYIDGVYQSKSTYSVSNKAITFSTAPASGHEIEVISTTGINSGPTAIYTDTFTANGSATAFTLGQTVHDENQTIVFLNGVYQFKGTYTLSGTTLTLDTAPANGVAIEVMSIGSAYSGGDILYDHDFTSSGLMTTNGSGVYSITANNSANWNTAYGWGDHSTQSYATQSYVGTQISNLVDSSPTTLNTLNELAAALGDDPNYATATAISIGNKLPLAGGTLTGALTGTTANFSGHVTLGDTVTLGGAVTIEGNLFMDDYNITRVNHLDFGFTSGYIEGSGTNVNFNGLSATFGGATNPYAFDTTATKFHVKNAGSSGSLSEIARFEGSTDADGSGGTIRLTTSNDRGIYFEGGRTGSVPYGKIGTTEYNGAKTLAITLDNSGNSTFANRVSAGESFNAVKNGADTVADGPFFGLKNAAGTRQYINQLDASNNIDYWYYNGSAWTQTISLLNDGGATFAGGVTAPYYTATNFINVKVDDAEVYWTNTANNDYWVWKRDASNNFILDHYNGSATSNALTFNSSQNATFAGNIYSGLNGMMEFRSSSYNNRQIGIDSQGFYVFNPNAPSGGRYDLKINDSGNATFAGNVILDSGKYLGVGNTTPAGTRSKLGVSFNVTGSAANLAESVTYATMELYPYRDGSTYGMFFGNKGTTAGYIQTANNSGNGTGHIFLNPFGGNIGIGTGNNSPNKALTVYGGNDNGIWIDSQGAQYTSLAFGNNGTEKANIAWDNTNGYTNISTYGNGHLALTTGGSINAFLNYSGNFAIGTTSPEFKLDVKSNSDTAPSAYLRGGKSSQGEIQNTGLIIGTQTTMAAGDYQGISFTGYTSSSAIRRGRAAIGVEAINGPGKMDLIFMTRFADDGTQLSSADEKMRIDTSGNVGIGTDSPTRKLDVAGEITHEGLVPKPGAFVDGLVTINKTVSISANTWTSLDISLSNIGGTGTFAVQVYSNAHGSTGGAWYSVYWSGIMSWYHSNTNDNDIDEIPLHMAGHARNNNTLELRTKLHTNDGTSYANRCELQIKTVNALSSAPISFRFRKLL